MNHASAPKALGAEAPSDALELRAIEQRQHLHDTVVVLRGKVADGLDIKKMGRRYFWPATGVAALLGWVLGYGIAGMFVQ